MTPSFVPWIELRRILEPLGSSSTFIAELHYSLFSRTLAVLISE